MNLNKIMLLFGAVLLIQFQFLESSSNNFLKNEPETTSTIIPTLLDFDLITIERLSVFENYISVVLENLTIIVYEIEDKFSETNDLVLTKKIDYILPIKNSSILSEKLLEFKLVNNYFFAYCTSELCR